MKKVIVITGCSSGLGKFLAEELAKKEYFIFAGIRDKWKGESLQRIWNERKLPIKVIYIDVTKEKSINDALKEIYKTKMKIDVLINNVGFTLAGSAMSATIKDFQNILDTNLLGSFRMIQAIYPTMHKQKYGKIITVTSLNGLLSLPNFALYSASKFGLQAFSNALKYEFQKENIWVTALAPGAIYSDSNTTKKNLPHKPAREKFFLLRILLPMVKMQSIEKKIISIIDSPNPPGSVIVGMDAHITLFLQRFLPRFLWEKLLFFIWNR